MRKYYRKLLMMFVKKDISKVTLRKEQGIAAGAVTKLIKHKDAVLFALLRICDYLIDYIRNNFEAAQENRGLTL